MNPFSGGKPTIANLGRNNTVKEGGRADRATADRPVKGSGDRSDRDATIAVDSDGVRVGDVTVTSDGTISRGHRSPEASGGGTFVVNEDSEAITHDCKGGDADIRGDGNTVRLVDCRVVTITGDSNTVRAGDAETLKVLGDVNTVHWSGDREPRISNLGDQNTIVKK